MINDREEEEEEEEDFRDSIVQETVGTEWDAAETAFVVLQESTLTITKMLQPFTARTQVKGWFCPCMDNVRFRGIWVFFLRIINNYVKKSVN
jgi:hypothetical protein